MYKRSSTTEVSSEAAALYDGGWRETDKDELIQEYELTAEEAEDLCRQLALIQG